jgi:tRNA-splicing ligase RtcB
LLTLRESPIHVEMFGEPGIDFDDATLEQIKTVARLPVVQNVALMPDAHLGYGMPIGGVCRTERSILPGAVGVDIACQVRLTILEISVEDLIRLKPSLTDALRLSTKFGLNAHYGKDHVQDHPVLHDSRWEDLDLPPYLLSKAREQLGSSGGGNHFANLMIGTVKDDFMDLDIGSEFVGLMTHSGSRNVGKQIADMFIEEAVYETSSIAKDIPRELAWLDVASDAGRRYWRAMQLMADYARANHSIIHNLFMKRAGLECFEYFTSVHNLAWQTDQGIVHRKGATPAEENRIAVIPGSCGTPSFLVMGKGNYKSMNSSSHGAGRTMSRTQAKKQYDENKFHKQMGEISHIGISPDETPSCYKDIRRVISLQDRLISPVAEMQPYVTMMGGKSDDGD